MSRSLRLTALALALCTLGVAGSAAARSAADEVNYATSFGQFGRDAYIYAAIDRGYMSKANIDVSVSTGTGSLDVIKLVASGRLDFAPVDIGALVVAKANEQIPVRVVSVVHQNTMSAILSLEETGIRQPRDLVGKTIADSPASTVRVLFPLYARKAGIDPAQVRFRDATPPSLPGLLASKQVDAVGQFVVGRPLFAKAAGKSVSALRYSDHLNGLLGIGIIAREDTIRNKPNLVRRFVRALNRGLVYSIANPGRTATIMKKSQPLTDEAVAAQELEIMRFFVATKGARKFGVGYIDLQKLKSTVSVIRNGFTLQNPISFRDLYAPGVVKVATLKGK